MDPMKFFAEMRRRNVFRVTGTYFVGAWVLVQIAFTLESIMQLPEWFDALFMSLMILGAPVVIILAWAFELTPEGFKRTASISKADSIAAQTGRKLEKPRNRRKTIQSLSFRFQIVAPKAATPFSRTEFMMICSRAFPRYQPLKSSLAPPLWATAIQKNAFPKLLKS